MTTLREVAQQALAALEDYERHTGFRSTATDALRAALAQQEQEQEPYCHIYEYDLPSGYKHRSFYPSLDKNRDANRAVAVYARPPRREWVSLTDDEIEMAWMTTPEIHQLEGLLFARAIEAKLKEKNHE